MKKSDKIKKNINMPVIGHVLFVIFVLEVLWGALKPVYNFDLLWMIKSGEVILQLGKIPMVDVFSYTAGNSLWVNHEWLSSILFFFIDKAGGILLLSIFKIFMMLAAFFISFRLGFLRNGKSLGAASLAGIWMMVTGFDDIEVRALLFSLVFIALTPYILEEAYSGRREKAIYLLVPLSVLWGNLHGGFILLFMFQGIYLFSALVENMLFSRKSRILEFFDFSGNPKSRGFLLNAFFAFMLSIAAGLLNPYTYKLYTMSLDTFKGGSFVKGITEYFPPAFFKEQAILTFTIIALTALIIFFHKRFRISDLFVAFAFTYLTAKSVRFMPEYELAMIPLAAIGLSAFGGWLRERSSGLWKSMVSIEKFAVPVLMILTIIYSFNMFSKVDFKGLGRVSMYFPGGAVEFLKSNHISGNMWNLYEWGGYLLYKLYPEYKVFIDGRAQIVYPDSVFDDYQATIDGGKAKETLDKYKVNFILEYSSGGEKSIRSKLGLYLENNPDWIQVFEDQQERILVRNFDENRDIIEKAKQGKLVMPVTPYKLNNEAMEAMSKGDLAVAEAKANQALSMDSGYIPAQVSIASVRAKQKNYDEALKICKKIADSKQKVAKLYYIMGNISELQGNREQAIKYYKKEIEANPGDIETTKRLRIIDAGK